MVEQPPEGTVTILFTDTVGSTALGVAIGDRAARERMRAVENLSYEQVARHGGRRIKSTGDGMMAVFTSARRAVECAVAIQRDVERLSLAQPAEALRLRAGLHSGDVVREHGDLMGSAANAAARIESAAGPGEIFVSETVRMLLGPGSGFRLTDRGAHTLKGFDEPWRLFEVAWREQTLGAAQGRLPLVGRERERPTMSRWLDSAANGRGLLALLGGEPGAGKSRLARELSAEAQARGFLTLTGHCYEMEGTPYGVFAEVFESAASTLRADELERVVGGEISQILKLVPRLKDRLPAAAPEPERSAAQERRLLLDAVLLVLERLAAERPLLVVLEDLHWIDASSLVVLQHVARRLAPMRAVVVGTYRDTETFPDRPFTGALGELVRLEWKAELRVARLPREAVAALLRAYGGADAPKAIVDLVVSETEGNPLFVEQVLKHLADGGRIFDASGRWRTDVTIAEDEVPHGVRHLIARRLDRVSADCRRVLTWAAIIGRVFSYPILRKLADFADEETLLDAMDEGERALLLAPELVSGEQRPAFVHELIRQTLLGELSQPRRQHLHARVADALQAAPDAAHHAADIAAHLVAAGSAADAARTIQYLGLAGREALGTAAFEQAHRQFDLAVSLAPEGARERAELLYWRGMAAYSMARWDLAEPDWASALAAAERANDADLAGRTALVYAFQLAYAARPLDNYAACRRGLAALRGAASGVHARLLALFAITGCDVGAEDYATGLEQLGRAAEIARAANDEIAYGEVVSATAHLHWRHMRMRESAAEYERARALLERAGEPYALANARAWHVLALVALGRFVDAEARADDVVARCERAGDIGAVFAARRALGYMDFARTGDLGRWNEFASADLKLLESIGSRFAANSHASLALGRFCEGRWDEALPHARRAVELAVEDSWAGACAAPLLLLHAYAGRRADALELLERERPHLPAAGRVSGSGGWELLPAAVEALATLGLRGEAAALYPVTLDAVAAGAKIRYFTRSSPELTAGIAAACGRHWERAIAHFEAALHDAHALPHRIEQPEARRWLAWMLLERNAAGDAERARALLGEALEHYAEIGMPRHGALAEALLARAGG